MMDEPTNADIYVELRKMHRRLLALGALMSVLFGAVGLGIMANSMLFVAIVTVGTAMMLTLVALGLFRGGRWWYLANTIGDLPEDENRLKERYQDQIKVRD